MTKRVKKVDALAGKAGTGNNEPAAAAGTTTALLLDPTRTAARRAFALIKAARKRSAARLD